jgi:hypothetical protein
MKISFCIYKRWDRNENHYGPIDDENSACGVLDGNTKDDDYIAYTTSQDMQIGPADAGCSKVHNVDAGDEAVLKKSHHADAPSASSNAARQALPCK